MTDIDRENESLEALHTKHRAQIERIIGLPSDKQQQAIAELGISPTALADHYPDFQERGMQLEKASASARSKSAWLGTIAFFAPIAAMFFKVKGKTVYESVAQSKLVRGILVGFASITAGVAGNFLGYQFFGKKVQTDSYALNQEVRTALEHELAIALENRERTMQAKAAEEAPEPRHSPIQPRGSYTQAHTAEKAAANQGASLA